MVLKRANMRLGIVLTLVLGVGILLGLIPATHSHDSSVAPSHCEACRWASNAAPAVAVLLVLLLTLAESGTAHLKEPALRAQTSRRRVRSRGPPLA